jgi:uncharacterized phage infection (PIP) family protein YhgE
LFWKIMHVFVSFDGDDIGKRAGLARLHDDVAEVRRVSQAIEQGNSLWESFATRVGGSVVEAGGDEGAIEIPAEHLGDMPAIAQQYAEAVGATVSVGVGMRLSDSSKALLVAKLRGKNQITIWDPEMEREIEAATAQPQAEKDKLAHEYLGKAQPGGMKGAVEKDQHTGFTGASTGSKVKGTQGDHEEGANTAKEFEQAQEEAPAAPEQTHAADDFEEQLHDLAQQQGHQDGQAAQAQDSHLDEVKNRLVETLQMVRQQLPVIEQLKATAPDIYQSIMALTQGLTDLGREVMGPGRAMEASGEVAGSAPVQKAEEECSSCHGAAGSDADCETCKEHAKKTELEKAALGAQGGAQKGRQHLKLPPGTVHDGAVKIQHGDGKVGWKHVRSGMVQGQDADAPVLGANSHPVSSLEPSSK